MSRYSDLKQLMVAVHEYHTTGNVPEDAEQLDAVCARVLEEDRFDSTAIDWKRISSYVKEIHGGDWPAHRKLATG